MPRTCTVCCHTEREAIDGALVTGDAFRHIAARFDTSTGALQRHKAEHLPVTLAKAAEAMEVANGDSLLEQLQSLQSKALSILASAERAGDLRTALIAVREVRGVLELVARITGELSNGNQDSGHTQVNVFRQLNIDQLLTIVGGKSAASEGPGVIGGETRAVVDD